MQEQSKFEMSGAFLQGPETDIAQLLVGKIPPKEYQAAATCTEAVVWVRVLACAEQRRCSAPPAVLSAVWSSSAQLSSMGFYKCHWNALWLCVTFPLCFMSSH